MWGKNPCKAGQSVAGVLTQTSVCFYEASPRLTNLLLFTVVGRGMYGSHHGSVKYRSVQHRAGVCDSLGAWLAVSDKSYEMVLALVECNARKR